jgi:hypothetical protein
MHWHGTETIGDNIGETRILPMKPTEWRVRGEKDPNAVDLPPHLLEHTRPRALERCVAATRGSASGGEEPDDDGDSIGEARAR